MQRSVIMRDIPAVGRLTRVQFRDLAATSNAAIARLAGRIQWIQSLVASDGTFCVYLADGENVLREHSRLAGFPITRIIEVPDVIDPMTAFAREFVS